jgi:ribonuclease BN (tRNA processing enzyme)
LPQVIFLGTNGWYDSDTGNTVSILIKTEEYHIILDAGYGIWKAGQYRDVEKPAYLFISHFHLDHIAGLHTIVLGRFRKGLTMLVQEGGTETLKRILSRPYTIPYDQFPFPASIIEVPKDKAQLPFRAEFLPMVHADPNIGVRIEIDRKVITYCPDTGYCTNAVELARNADLLITECAFRPGEDFPLWPHLNPETAARIAKEAQAGRLALTHFDAEKYKTMEQRKEAEKKAREIFEQSFMTRDGMIIEV